MRFNAVMIISARVMESHRHWIEVTRSVEDVGSNPTLLTNGLLTR